MAGYNLGTATGRIVVDGSGAAKGFQVASAAAEGFYSVIQGKLDSLRQLGENLLKVGAVGGASLGVAITAAASFEQRLSAIEAVSGATASEMDKISKAALRIGKDTKFSATEAASAMEELVKAGVSVDDVLNGAADATVALAAAGEISLPQAAEIAASAMNNFGLSAQELPKVADLIAGAANASAISVGEFASSMQQVGAVANLAGVPIEDVAVAIAEMGNAGIKGSDAGTSLKTMLLNLIPVTERQKSKMEELGLLTFDAEKAMVGLAKNGIIPASSSLDDISGAVSQYIADMGGAATGTDANAQATQDYIQSLGAMNNAFFDANGNVKSFADIQGILKDSIGDMTKEQQLATLETIFGQDAIRAAAVATAEGAEGFNELAAAMGQVTAADVAATRMDNLAGSIEELKGSFETALITIGNVFLPIVRKVVDGIKMMIDVFNNLPSGVQTAIAVIFGLGTAFAAISGAIITLSFILGPLLAKFLLFRTLASVGAIFSTFFRSILTGTGVLTAARTAFTSFGGILLRLKNAIMAVVGVAKFMGAAWALITGPVGIAIGVILALIAVGKLLYDNFEPFRNLVDGIAASLASFFAPAVEAVRSAWDGFLAGLLRGQGVLSGFSGVFNTLGLGLRAVVTAFQEGDVTSSGFVGAMERIGVAARTVWEALQELGAIFMSEVMPALRELGGSIMATAVDAFNSLKDVATGSLLPALTQLGQVIINDLWPALQQIAMALWPIIKVIGIVVGVIVGTLLVVLFQIAKFVLGTVLPALIQFVGFLLGVFIGTFAAIARFIIQYLIAPFIRFVALIIGVVAPAVASFVSAVVGFIGTLVGWFVSAFKAVVDFFSGIGEGASEGSSAFGGFVQGIIDWVVNLYNSVVSFLVMIRDAFVSGFQSLVGFLMPVLAPIIQVFQAIFDLIVAIVRLGWEIIRGIFLIAAAVIVNIVQFLVNGIVSIFQSIMTFVAPIVAALVAFVVARWQQIQAITAAVWNTIKEAVGNAIQAVLSIVIPIVARVLSVVSAAWNAISAATSAAFNVVRSVVSSALSVVQAVISSGINAARSAWQAGVDGIVSAVSNITSRVMGPINSVISAVRGAFSGAIGWLTGAGADIVQGLANGITNAIGRVTAAAGRMADAVRSKVSGVLDILSPSRVMRSLGKEVPKGFALGIQDEIDRVENMAATMGLSVGEAVGAMSPGTYTPDGYGGQTQLAPVAGTVVNQTVNQTINAPQNMSPDQVAAAAASRTGYALGNMTRPIPISAGATK